MECCGFVGPQEFAYSTLPIDDSCYDVPAAAAAAASTTSDELYDDEQDWAAAAAAESTTPRLRLKQVRIIVI